MVALLAPSGEPVSFKILGLYVHLPDNRDELIRIIDLLIRLFSKDILWFTWLVQVIGRAAHVD